MITGTCLSSYLTIFIWFYEPLFRLLLELNQNNGLTYQNTNKTPILHKVQNITALICTTSAYVDTFIEIFVSQNVGNNPEFVLSANIIRVFMFMLWIIGNLPVI